MSNLVSNIITAIITAGLTLLIAYISFKYFKKKPVIFHDRLNNHAINAAFSKFLFENREKIFFIDISLTDDNIQRFKDDFSFFLITSETGSIFDNGLQVRFRRKDEEDMFIDYRFSSKRIKGYFKVVHSSGPQQGQFTYVLSHVPVEAIYNNI